MFINPDGLIYLYGPSGSGKSTAGRSLAGALGLPFCDLDEQIARDAQKSVADIFAAEGEASFRQRERAALQTVAGGKPQVVALGGGALLLADNRRLAEATGRVLCLDAALETLVARLTGDGLERPLLSSDQATPTGNRHRSEIIRNRLAQLMQEREAHYASFSDHLSMDDLTLEQAAWQMQVRLGMFRVSGMGAPYDVRVIPGGLEQIGALFRERQLDGPTLVVGDSNVAGLYGPVVLSALQSKGYSSSLATIPPGEAHKNMRTIEELWSIFLAAGLDRSSCIIALGGGVVGDLTGFAAATYLRGVRWVGIPTTLLAMVDASLGGKTGADLPQGKNLIGAFHSPSFVLADPQALASLPEAELRSGLAEVVKHGVIGDRVLFELCARGWDFVVNNLDEIVRRGMAVKVQVILEDPFEQGRRAALNLGHTLGHALEVASDYRLRHGEGVAIGMVAAARYSEKIGLGEAGLAQKIGEVLSHLGLPTEIPPGLDRERVIAGIEVDKKRKRGKVRLALPVRVGEVQVGIPLENPNDLVML